MLCRASGTTAVRVRGTLKHSNICRFNNRPYLVCPTSATCCLSLLCSLLIVCNKRMQQQLQSGSSNIDSSNSNRSKNSTSLEHHAYLLHLTLWLLLYTSQSSSDLLGFCCGLYYKVVVLMLEVSLWVAGIMHLFGQR